MDEESIFLEALQKPTPAERMAFVDRACAGNGELRASIEQLLQAHDRAGSFLQANPGIATIDEPISERPGTVIGSYKLLEKIGEGGFGVVFMAEQRHPVRRKVALKVLKPGMDTREVIARFEVERQALALMDHANIARVFDGGETASGRPYFVMELVKGIPINDYCDQSQLTPRQRLELFIPVCQAVQHAHQKGIIHRDLKPSNILVTLHDGTPVVKVIDFGIAKATGQQLTEKTLFTNFAQLIGTPLYMSPEQAALSGLDVDTRSDIYSLGVLLYELLTGTTPFEKERFREAGYDEIRRIIREEEPPKPSARISTLGQAATTASTQRRSDPRRLSLSFRGELDWIVMKALEKDRNRRYETASAFAADVHRYLHDEPVQAYPPSSWYRVRKLARRKKGALTTAALLTAALVVTTVVLAISNVRVKEESDRKEQALEDREAALEQAREESARKEQALKDREAALEQAKEEERKAKTAAADRLALIDFIQKKILAAARPRDEEGGLGITATIREAIDAAAPQIAEAFREQPLVEADVRDTLGATYLFLGEPAMAIRQRERSLALFRAHGSVRETLISMNNLANSYKAAKRFDLALSLFEETLKLGEANLEPDDVEMIGIMTNLGAAYRNAGKPALGLPLLIHALVKAMTKLGPDDPKTLTCLNNLAAASAPQEALPLYDELLKLREAKLGRHHPGTLTVLNNMAAKYQETGRHDLAVPLYERAVADSEPELGTNHSTRLEYMFRLAVAYDRTGKLEEAVRVHEDTLRLRRARLGADHLDTYHSMNNLAFAYERQGHHDNAEPLWREMAALEKKRSGAESQPYLSRLFHLSACLLQQQKYTDAETCLRDCLAVLEKKWPDIFETYKITWQLGGSLLGQKKYADALPLLLQGYEGMKQRQAKESTSKRWLIEALEQLVQCYEALDQPQKAEECRKKLIAEMQVDERPGR